ncbi:helix-turn-helix domain-containing protein [Variovorax paradoxus]|uniref:helix-turn-helix domain-containing protein n=1 Tax=Variovorax paradoxus TaxID=34073 RepID=UPI003D648E7F
MVAQKKPARKTKPATQPAAPAEVPAHVELGVRLRQRRLEAGLTLAALADEAGFGKAYLSRIENGKKVPPIGSLARIAGVLGIEAASLLTDNTRAQQSWRGVSLVKRADKRPTVMGGSAFGYDYLSLTDATTGRALQPFLFTFPDKVDKFVFFEHEGEEMMHVLTGRVEWQVGMDKFILEPGDTLHFDSRIPHRGHALVGPATALVVIYSPAGCDGNLA